VADHFVSQMLRQGDASVFKRYSQAKLNMMRESLTRLDRKANELSNTRVLREYEFCGSNGTGLKRVSRTQA